MSGPEHYVEAERLLAESDDSIEGVAEWKVAKAQVHATLALAAATAESAFDPEGRALVSDGQAWAVVW